MIWLGTFLAILSIGVLRVAWNRPRRVPALNLAGWGLMFAGLAVSAQAHGAWGITIAGLAAVGTALLLLLPDALAARAPLNRAPVRSTPERAPLRLGRRITTFLLTVPLGFIIALALSVACYALADLAGWHRANSVMLALMLLPILWAIFATLLLMKQRA